MTGSQGVVLAIVLALLLSSLYFIFVLVPGLVWTALTIRLRDQHRQLGLLMSEDPLIAQREDVETLHDFLDSALCPDSHFGLSGALALITGVVLLEDDPDSDGQEPFEGLGYAARIGLLAMTADTLRLTFCRAFMGSALWFIAWPGAIWALHRFRRVDANDEEWSATARIIPLEPVRERLVHSAHPGVLARHHQPVG